jgi:restriction system protein
VHDAFSSSFAGTHTIEEKGNAGSLINLDLKDQSIPLAEVRKYLAARYDDRFHIDPAIFEQVVASVYSDHDFHVRVTAKTGDGGIDAIFDASDGSVTGVQVKRYAGHRRITVEQIHSFAGALIRKGLPAGLFVTTSDFQRGAHVAASDFAKLGTPIELVNAVRFYEALGISQRRAYKRVNDRSAPFAKAPLLDLAHPERNREPKPWEYR